MHYVPENSQRIAECLENISHPLEVSLTRTGTPAEGEGCGMREVWEQGCGQMGVIGVAKGCGQMGVRGLANGEPRLMAKGGWLT